MIFWFARSSIESASEIPDAIEAEAERQATLHQRRESVLESFEKNQVTIQLNCYTSLQLNNIITSWQDYKLTRLQVYKTTCWQDYKFIRLHVDKITSWLDYKLKRLQVDRFHADKITSWKETMHEN